MTNQIEAERAAFRSFANSYLREINTGRPVFHRVDAGNVDCLELFLASRGVTLRIEMLSRSLCGLHRFGRIWLRPQIGAAWRELEPMLALHLLVLAARQPGDESHHDADLELLERVLLSYRAIATHLGRAARQSPARPTFLAAEQSLYFGHPLHPTPKSLQGMADWQQPAYAPEFGGAFQLHYFRACSSLVRHDSARAPVATIVRELLGDDAGRLAGHDTVLPVHPLQAQALLLDADIRALVEAGKLLPLGAAGPLFAATSSVRTLYNEDVAWMPKFSLPVRITNSKRLNKRHELHDAVAVTRFFDDAGLNDFHPRLAFMHDAAYVRLELPGKAESGFEVLFRENNLVRRAADPLVTVSALTAEPLPGQISMFETLVGAVAAERRLSRHAACLLWFAAYLDCVLEPTLELYDRFGVALEAHQQNSLLDLADGGLPTRLVYRDGQGFYLSARWRERWCRLTPDLATAQNLFFDDAEIQQRFAYYLVVNQIFAVIARAGHDGLATEAELLGMLRARLVALRRGLSGCGAELAAHLLERPQLAAKANLTLRLANVDELTGGGAVYCQFPNPLSTVGLAIASEAAHALAS